MASVTFKGTAIRLSGEPPAAGDAAPPFHLTAADLSEKGLDAFTGNIKILSVVPSLDTEVCAVSARKFNEAIARFNDTVLLNVSVDLPFAQKRFCDAGKLDRVVTLSAFRAPKFGDDYGLRIEEGPLAGLLARAVFVIDRNNRITHAQLVPEIAQEPDYDAVLAAVEAARG
jgi:thiol peroxidase